MYLHFRQRVEHYCHLQGVQDASDCLGETTDIEQCEGCLWSLVLSLPSAGNGMVADEAKGVAITSHYIHDSLVFLCLLHTG